MSFRGSLLVRDRGLSDSVRKVRIALIGAKNVGKTSIAQKYVQKSLRETKKGRMEHKLQKRVGNFLVEILDEYTDGFNLNNLSSCDAFVLVYSVDNMDSFDYLSNLRDNLLLTHGENIPVVVAGNKSELTIRKVHGIMADCIVTIDWEHPHFEVSAKTNYNISALFKKVLDHPSFQQCPTFSNTTYINRRRSSALSSPLFRDQTKCISKRKDSIAEEQSVDIEMQELPKRGFKSRFLSFFSSKVA